MSRTSSRALSRALSLKTPTQRTLVFSIVVASLAGLLFWVYYDGAVKTDFPQPLDSAPEISNTSAVNPATSLAEPGPGANHPEASPVGLSPWATPSQMPPADETPHVRSDIQEKALVKIDRSTIERWQVEDLVELPIPQTGQMVRVQIDKIERLPSGNKSIVGHLEGNLDSGFIMTVGTRSIFATIGSEDGIFNLRGNDDYAWLISSRQLKRNFDPDIPDYRVPEAGKN